ncbi:hypothetical protein BV494_15770 [Rahnella sikkimica]|uniref:Uncharacterized protein n=1 Tax=Rahnella sikkimica TaxID=1805933 RepID=A0A2L1UTK8_9GAMM|nr:hypothetical protein BV494_15770 [Rahnella sikkimica]
MDVVFISQKGSALATFSAFLDLSLEITGPLAGMLMVQAGIDSIYWGWRCGCLSRWRGFCGVYRAKHAPMSEQIKRRGCGPCAAYPQTRRRAWRNTGCGLQC